MGFFRHTNGPLLATKTWYAPPKEEQDAKKLQSKVRAAHAAAEKHEQMQFETREFLNWSLAKTGRRRQRGDSIRSRYDGAAAGRNSRLLEEAVALNRENPGNQIEAAADDIVSGRAYRRGNLPPPPPPLSTQCPPQRPPPPVHASPYYDPHAGYHSPQASPIPSPHLPRSVPVLPPQTYQSRPIYHHHHSPYALPAASAPLFQQDPYPWAHPGALHTPSPYQSLSIY